MKKPVKVLRKMTPSELEEYFGMLMSESRRDKQPDFDFRKEYNNWLDEVFDENEPD